MSKEDRKGERRMKKALVLLVVAIIVCQGFAVLALTARAQAPPESAPEVVCVPFHGTLLGVPHDAWIGKEITLKGTAHDPDGDGTLDSYKWDFGDGYSTGWITGVNPYALEAKHTYTGTMEDGTTYGPGKFFTAWLYVKDIDGNIGKDSYFIAIRDISDPKKKLEFEVNVAIDNGLWWLHKTQYRYSSGGIDYGRWQDSVYYAGPTSTAVLAFEIHGHMPIGDKGEDPYVDTVQRGLNYVFTRCYSRSISGPSSYCPYGDPDTNGNGIGIDVSSGRRVYEIGMVMMAIAASGDPDLVAATGPTNVVGRTYFDILTDMVDMCAWGQNEVGSGRGGWRYDWNYPDSDNSVTQWPIIGLEAAETNWGIEVAEFVKSELDIWLAYSQSVTGGFGYTSPEYWYNPAKTGAGLCGLAYIGLPPTDTRVVKAINYLDSRWGTSGTDGYWGNYYSLYAIMKGCKLFSPEIEFIGSHNWYWDDPGGFARYLVNQQWNDGRWPAGEWASYILDTGWAILTLTPTITFGPPVADAGSDVDNHPPEPVLVKFDASGSYHTDPTKNIVLYEWDFESDGTWDYSGTDVKVEHAYPAFKKPDGSIDWDKTAKDYTATLRVTDDSDPPFQDTDACVIHITAPPWKPVADPDGPYEGYEGVPIQLDGSKSYDPESRMYAEDHPWYETIAKYEWDLDNDGQFDDSMEINPSFSWETKGSYSVGLRVTDTQPSGPGGTVGLLDVDTKYATVVISAATHNIAYITVVYPDTPQEEIDDQSLDDIKDLAGLVERYYSQQSYGTVSIMSDFIFEDWETMEKNLEDYLIPPPSGWDHPSNGIEAELWRPVANDAVELAGVDEDDYDAIVILQPEPMRAFAFQEWLFWIGKKVIVHWEEDYGTIAHELGHAVFKFGDYYSESWHWTAGDVKDWGLMGTGSLWNPPAPITCWNKIQAGWLKERHVSRTQIPGEFKVGLLQRLNANDEVIVYSVNRFEGRHPPDGVEQDPSIIEYGVLKEKKGIAIYQKDWLGKIHVVPHDNDDFTTVTLLPGETYYDFWREADYTAVEEDSELYIRIEPHPIWETIIVALQNVEFEIPELSVFSADLSDTSLDFDLHVFTTEGDHIGMNYEYDEYEIEADGATTSGNIPGAGPEWIAFPSDSEIAYLTIDPTPAREFAEGSGLTVSNIRVTLQIRYYDSDGNAWESELVTTSAGLEEPTLMRYAIIQNPDGTYTPVLDNTPPMLTVEVPQEDSALQDGVTLNAHAWDENGVSSVTFSIREPNGEHGTPISPDFEYISASISTDDRWILPFDTTQLPDGYYLAYVEATDIAGNKAHNTTSFSIRNWACIELLPATESNKAGRTMPVKFSLRVAEGVDPAQPFVYNEELTIVIYEEGHPDSILQESAYGDTARDYRINSENELYITNFRTPKKKLTTYVVEIYRKDMLIGRFTFETVK